MLLLAFDTAGPDCAAAVLRGEPGSDATEILARRSERIGRGHAERLIPMIEAALSDAGIAFRDLSRVAVTIGPGSFTGVRVGVAAARGLALALGIEAVGVGSLAALAFGARRRQSDGTVVATLDAKRGEVYALAKDAGSGAELIAATAIAADDLVARMSPFRRPLVLVGAAAPIVGAALGRTAFTVAGTPEAPEIADVATLGLLNEGASPPVPLYVRGADAKPQRGKALARQ